jgi:hypothetical protein
VLANFGTGLVSLRLLLLQRRAVLTKLLALTF